MAARRLARKVRPFWERGYKAHGYWAGKKKLGAVHLREDAAPEEKYRWEAGTHAGFTATLTDGKRAVEEAVLLGTSQLSLLFAEAEQAS